MYKKLIVGSGYSAMITQILLGKNTKIYGYVNKFPKNVKYFRRKSLEINKIFKTKSISVGSLEFQLNKIKLHDRLCLSGNTDIWGGFINIKEISCKYIHLLKKNKIFLNKLSFKNTGSFSNKNISQITNENKEGEILKTSQIIRNIKNSYLFSLSTKNKTIILNFKNQNKNEIVHTKKVVLCLGTIQLLDLLYRSKYLKNNDIITLDEFNLCNKFLFTFKPYYFKKSNKTIIRYKFGTAFLHFLGIKKRNFIVRIMDLIPIYVDQVWDFKKNKITLKINNQKVIGNNSNIKTLGASIHYCNMKINNLNINKFIKLINPNIEGVGMSFVKQKFPGPISNDIFLDSIKKFKRLMI